MKSIFLRALIIGMLGLLSTNCEDGDIGPSGEDGVNGVDGANGADGANGTNGINGVGFDELAKFGAITLTLEGTRPDNVAFSKTEVFKFTAVEDIDRENTVTINDNSLFFHIERFLSTPDDEFQDSELDIELTVSNPGEQNEAFEFLLEITDYTIIYEDLTFFGFDDSFTNDNPEVSNFSITDFNFNDDTNVLTFSFAFEVARIGNDTGNDLSVSGEVNVIVLDEILDQD